MQRYQVSWVHTLHTAALVHPLTNIEFYPPPGAYTFSRIYRNFSLPQTPHAPKKYFKAYIDLFLEIIFGGPRHFMPLWILETKIETRHYHSTPPLHVHLKCSDWADLWPAGGRMHHFKACDWSGVIRSLLSLAETEGWRTPSSW